MTRTPDAPSAPAFFVWASSPRHTARVPLELIRIVDPNSALDVDPLTTQPGADAFEAVTVRGKEARFVAWEMTADGRRVSPPTTTSLDIGAVIFRDVEIPTEGVEDQAMWSRGAINFGTLPGEEQVQTQLVDGFTFSAIVTGFAGTAASSRIYLYLEVDP